MRNLAIILLLTTAVAALVLYLNPELRRELQGELRELPGGSALPPAETTLYKWQDDQGVWQLSDHPPADGRPYQTRTIDHATNVVPALKPVDE